MSVICYPILHEDELGSCDITSLFLNDLCVISLTLRCTCLAQVLQLHVEPHSVLRNTTGRRKKCCEYIVGSLPLLWTCDSEKCRHSVLRSLFGCRKLVEFVRECGRNYRRTVSTKIKEFILSPGHSLAKDTFVK